MNWFKKLFRRKPLVPKESLRSLIIEGVINVKVKHVGYNNYCIQVNSKIPTRSYINANNELVLCYADWSSPTVINDSGHLGNVFA
jgi:hypothetical protein